MHRHTDFAIQVECYFDYCQSMDVTRLLRKFTSSIKPLSDFQTYVQREFWLRSVLEVDYSF